MLSNKNKLSVAVGVALGISVVCSPVYAEGFYLGAGVNSSSIDNGVAEQGVKDVYATGRVEADLAPTVILSGVDASAGGSKTGLKLYGGYQFNRNFAIEAQYNHFGKFSSRFTTTGDSVGGCCDGPEGGVGRGTHRISGFGAAVVGTLPLTEQFDLFAKVGAFHWKMRTSTDIRTTAVGYDPDSFGVNSSVSASDSGTSAYGGLGGQYAVTKNVKLRLEWERFRVASDNLDSIGLSLNYQFK